MKRSALTIFLLWLYSVTCRNISPQLAIFVGERMTWCACWRSCSGWSCYAIPCVTHTQGGSTGIHGGNWWYYSKLRTQRIHVKFGKLFESTHWGQCGVRKSLICLHGNAGVTDNRRFRQQLRYNNSLCNIKTVLQALAYGGVRHCAVPPPNQILKMKTA